MKIYKITEYGFGWNSIKNNIYYKLCTILNPKYDREKLVWIHADITHEPPVYIYNI